MMFEKSKAKLVLVLTSEVNSTTANALAKEILNQRLAECVTLRLIKIYFWWDVKLHEYNEVQILIKTTNNQLQNLLEVINQLHSYTTPELLYWNVSANEDYCKWVESIVDFNSK